VSRSSALHREAKPEHVADIVRLCGGGPVEVTRVHFILELCGLDQARTAVTNAWDTGIVNVDENRKLVLVK
jgi:hypothetical protein